MFSNSSNAFSLSGISLEEIAGVRGLTVGTIKSHFAKWILSGEIKVQDVLPAETIQPLEKFLRESEEKTVAAVFRKFGDKYEGGDVRMVLNYVIKTSSAAEKTGTRKA